jgi:hypothetical protein
MAVDLCHPTNKATENDNNYLLRRALLLRSFCERKLNPVNGKMPINEDVLWAMLLTPKYKHGARSMETIFNMSRIENNEWKAAALPAYSQLSLHVDADIFLKLVLREIILNSHLEKLAKAIHKDFCEKNPTSDNNKPWEQLTNELQERNRDQAREYAGFLKEIGCSYDTGDTLFATVKEFTAEEIEKIAIKSHNVWIAGKHKAGWVWGEKKDAIKKTHPCLCAWDDPRLTEEEKDKDRDIAKKIIPQLENLKFRVYRVE